MGLFAKTIEECHEDYIKPQENGSHYGCEWVKVYGASGGLKAEAVSEPISFNASVYTQEMLTKAQHNFELEKSGNTVFCIDYMQSGVGSNSCGPQLMGKYRLDADSFTFGFMLIPL